MGFLMYIFKYSVLYTKIYLNNKNNREEKTYSHCQNYKITKEKQNF